MSDTDKDNNESTQGAENPPVSTEPDTKPESSGDSTSGTGNSEHNADHVTRSEFSELSGSVAKLTDSVSELISKLGDSAPLGDTRPVKMPWTHYGSRPRND